jgi:hypothetical protein
MNPPFDNAYAPPIGSSDLQEGVEAAQKFSQAAQMLTQAALDSVSSNTNVNAPPATVSGSQ